MAKILLIISALVIAATAYLGFATKQKVDAMQGDLAQKKSAAQAAQTEAANSKKAQKKAEEDLIAAKAEVDAKNKEVAAKKAEVDKLAADVKKAGDDLAAANAELEKMKTAGPAGLPVDVEKMTARIEELTKAKADLEGKVAELTQVQETWNRKVTDATAKATSYESQVKAYKEVFTRQGLTGTITAYNPGWNFVVLNIGDRQSLKVGKEMVVKRGGQMIAKVKVTSVDPSTSIADIIPNTVAKGQNVEPGDSVVYEGRSVY